MTRIPKYLILFFASWAMFLPLQAQLQHLECGWEYYALQERLTGNAHSSIYPLYRCDVVDTTLIAPKDLLNYTFTNYEADGKYYRVKKFIFSAQPLIHSEILFNTGSNFSGGYGAGVLFDAEYNNTIATHFDLSYVNFAMTDYINEFRLRTGVLPGTGRVIKQRFPQNIYSNFNITYRPFQLITLEAGFGKHFWGDGYRSMMLSYNAYNYPYIMADLNVWHVQYRFVVAQMKDINVPEGTVWGDFKTKYAYIHYIDWKVCKWFNFGAFEAIISGVNHGFEPGYLNPVIFYRPVEFSLGSVDNALMGINLKFKLLKNTYLYGQFVLDDFNVDEYMNDIRHLRHPDGSEIHYGFFGNKVAGQIGLKSSNIGGINYLHAFTEFNFARPYTYSHVVSQQNYGHFNQSLAHPLGANFVESVSGISYLHKRFLFEGKFMLAFTGLDTTGTHFGQDIYKPTMDALQNGNIPVSTWYNRIGQGIETNIIYTELSAQYFINPDRNLSAIISIGLRHQQNELATQQNVLIKIGVSGLLIRRYTDF